MAAPSLDIFVESKRRFPRGREYKLHRLLKGLKSAGLEWRLIDTPKADWSPAPTAFFHVDLTDLPDKFRGVAERYERTTNGAAYSIRRTQYTTARVFKDSPYTGPVIAKTILNSQGLPEARYNWEQSFTGWIKHLAKWSRDRHYLYKSCPDYTIYNSIKDVPPDIWRNEDWMVERFIPGTLAPPTIKYRYEFLFDLGFVAKSTCTTPMCDIDSVIDLTVEDTPPPSVAALRKKLHLDYGSIDFFIVDGETHIIDANKTVSVSDEWIAAYPHMQKHIKELTDRLIAFVRRG